MLFFFLFYKNRTYQNYRGSYLVCECSQLIPARWGTLSRSQFAYNQISFELSVTNVESMTYYLFS